MSDPSPFTLVRPAGPAAEQPATTAAGQSRVVLPTKRKEIPQATEPAGIPPHQRDARLRDAVARMKKAEKAPPLEPAPRPPRQERERVLATPAPQAAPKPAPGPLGATILPPPRKSTVFANEEATTSDPFETNVAAAVPADCAPTQRLVGSAPPTPTPALSPSAIRKASLANPTEPQAEQAQVALVPRQKPVHAEFVFQPTPVAKDAPEPRTEAPPQKSKTTLPAPKNLALQSSFKDMQQWLEADGVALKVHTPNSDAPIEKAELKEPENVLVTATRLQFNCPACHHTVSTPKRLAGRKARCPQCSGAIRAPHPKFGRGAYSYENKVEALLHPETFVTANPKRPKFLGVPVPTTQVFMVTGAAAIMILGGIWMIHYRAQTPASLIVEANPDAAPIVSKPEPYLDKDDGFAIKNAAEKLVADFLAAEGWEQKAAFVRDAERVAPLMKDYYERGHESTPIRARSIHASAPSYYQGEQLKQRRSNVTVELADSEKARYVVEFLPEGALIEWESSVAYSPTSWEDILASETDKKSPPHMLRVAACIDRYYNNEFSNDREYLSVYLQDPITGEPLGNGYIARSSEDGIRLRKFLYGSSKNNPDQIMIEVRPVENSKQDRVVAITKFLKSGFRQAESEAFASVK